MPVGDAGYLWQMGDRQHLRLLAEALERRRHRVRGHAADAGVDLVEDERLSARDRGERESDAGELAAGGRFRHGTERKPWFGPDQKDGLVRCRSGQARARPSSTRNSPSPIPSSLSSAATASASRSTCARRTALSSSARARHAGLRRRDRVRSGRNRVLSCSRLVELTSGVRRSLEELVERRRRETALEVGDPGETAFDLLERAWIRLQ